MTQLNLKSLEPKIVILPEIKLVAKSMPMSFAQDKTHVLWQDFSPLIKGIPHKLGKDKYSIQIFPDTDFFKNFNPTSIFKKYAAVNVSEYGALPDELEKLIIPEGQYALFDYIGKPSAASETFRYILCQWVPNSKYSLDDRPHIAKMGEKYKGEQPDSEEALLIPIT